MNAWARKQFSHLSFPFHCIYFNFIFISSSSFVGFYICNVVDVAGAAYTIGNFSFIKCFFHSFRSSLSNEFLLSLWSNIHSICVPVDLISFFVCFPFGNRIATKGFSFILIYRDVWLSLGLSKMMAKLWYFVNPQWKHFCFCAFFSLFLCFLCFLLISLPSWIILFQWSTLGIFIRFQSEKSLSSSLCLQKLKTKFSIGFRTRI